MVSILDSLKGINAYPVPLPVIDSVAVSRGLNLFDVFTESVARSPKYALAMSDLYLWLAQAPSISQGGQSYSFTDSQREEFSARARALRRSVGDDTPAGVSYGYKGSRL